MIKEPYFKRALDGSEMIRVDEPDDVEFLKPSLQETIFECFIKSIDEEEIAFRIATMESSIKIEKGMNLYFKNPN